MTRLLSLWLPFKVCVRHGQLMRFTQGIYLPSGGRLGWAKLTHRGLIRLTGPDSLSFLQGLITNDTKFLEQFPEQSMYALMLNNKGRVIHDLLIHRVIGSDSNQDFLIECDRDNLKQFGDTLLKYRLRKKVELIGCTDSMSLYAFFPRDFQSLSLDQQNEPYLTPVQTLKDSWKPAIFCLDPRFTGFGVRFAIPKNDDPRVYVDEIGPDETTIEEYDEARYYFGIPEGAKDLPIGKALPLESNADYLNGVSFHKGCYIGQELTARTHHTGVVRKRLMPLKFDSDQTERLKSVSQDAKIFKKDDTDIPIGKFRASRGRYGLGLLNIEKALEADKLVIQISDEEYISAETWIPSWWMHTELTGQVRGFQPPDST